MILDDTASVEERCIYGIQKGTGFFLFIIRDLYRVVWVSRVTTTY
jgi:hypothetical protein